MQDKLADKSLTAGKVPGPGNPADLVTKHLTGEVIDKHLERLSCKVTAGRSEIAPSMVATFGITDRTDVKIEEILRVQI